MKIHLQVEGSPAKAIDSARAIADSGRRKAHKIESAKKAPLALYRADNPHDSLDDVAKVRLLERLEAMARAEDPRVSEVMASLVGTWEVVMVARSDGHLAADVRPLVRVSVTVIMEENGRREQGSGGGGGRYDYGYFSDEVLTGFARAAVHQARVNLGAGPAPAGLMTVVLGNAMLLSTHPETGPAARRLVEQPDRRHVRTHLGHRISEGSHSGPRQARAERYGRRHYAAGVD